MSEGEVINPAEAKLIEFKKDPMKELSLDVIEKVLVGGDLAVLTPKERLDYVNAVCRSVGLNPLTQPLAYIKLNNRLTLYARKDCTEQLRKIHSVSVDDLKEQMHDDVLTITAYVSMPSGRKDAAKGAVSIDKLKGEALAIALMKCETKAKRRATLSICGLGFLDEAELDYIDAETPHVTEKKKKRETGSLEKLKKSEDSPNRGHGNEGIKEALEVPGVQKGTDSLKYTTVSGSILKAFYHESKDETKKWVEVSLNKNADNSGVLILSCWHRSLFECLLKKPNQIVLSVKNLDAQKGSPTIEDVLSVDGVKYAKGVPEAKETPTSAIVDEEPRGMTTPEFVAMAGNKNLEDVVRTDKPILPSERDKRNESILELSNTLEKLWPAANKDLRPLRNKVGQSLLNLERKEQLMDLSYPQISIDAALVALRKYLVLEPKPGTEQGIVNEITNMFNAAKEEIQIAELPPPGDLFA